MLLCFSLLFVFRKTILCRTQTIRRLIVQAALAMRRVGRDLALELLPFLGFESAGGHFLQMNNGLSGVKTLRAASGAVHDTMATVQFHCVVQPCQTSIGHLISGINDPTESLLQNGGAKVVLRVPPVGRTGSCAACAQDALVQAIQQLTVLLGLVMLDSAFGIGVMTLGLTLQPGLDGFVLIVEISQIRDEILHDVGVRQWKNVDGRILIGLDVCQAR